ncbi:MAG: hypothetical protein KGI78_02200 [Patescibacteria group bacterium]|nr:hypothetical protein [Patescibacteria group bacterium]MDE2057645.1 hypothetical protein [Patescibacteria group bacterium]
MPDPTRRRLKIALAALGAVVVALLIFHAGVAVGSREALRARGPRLFAFGSSTAGLPHVFIVHGHGAIGSVTSVAQGSFTLLTRDGSSETVEIATTTAVRSASGEASTTALAAGDTVLVLGAPASDGAIRADVIRIFATP